MISERVRPYEYMIYPTLQTAWIRGKGILLFAGLYFVESGAGLFLAASIFHSFWGETAGWLISGILGGGSHFLFLGHPFRIYRAVKRPGKAWISRGLLIISLFQLFSFIHLVLSYLSVNATWVLFVAQVLAVATILYGGFEIADVKSIPIWHSGFLPVQMLVRSFLAGFSVLLAVNLMLGLMPGTVAGEWLSLILIIMACLFVFGLVSIGVEESKEKISLRMMMKGELKWMSWLGVVGGGMIVPLIVGIYGLTVGEPKAWVSLLAVAVLLQVIGDLLLRYGLIRTGYFPGIFPCMPKDFRR
jgi:sulfite dehydrogenase (quinone) subunit SoeC